MTIPDARETLADAIDFARRNDDLVHLDLEVAEALLLELRPDPQLTAAWAHRGKLRSAAASMAKAIEKRGDAVRALAGGGEDMDRAVAFAANAVRELLEQLDELEPPDEVYTEVRS